MWNNVANIPSLVPRAAYVPAGSRNPPAFVSAGRAFPAGSRNPPASVSASRAFPAGSRNPLASVSAGRAFPAGSRNIPTSVSAGRPFSAGWRNHAVRPMTRPTSHYFQHFRRPGCYNQLYMDDGRWGTVVKTSPGKQHKASYKAITAVRTISEPLQLLHVDLFGHTSIRSIDHKYYSLVVTDDLSRFSWVFFLGTKDETYYILKDFITFIENQLNKKVKAIRCDNETEFKNSKLIELCGSKGIKRDYSNARTPQQNGVAERKNRTLIEAARTMLADSKLPTMFWTEAVSTACYVLNRVLVTRPHNKTPYELLSGKVPNISHLKPFGCHVTILNISDHLGKFEGKADEGFIVAIKRNMLQLLTVVVRYFGFKIKCLIKGSIL
ncbi:putative ribonuclease H-like domain-containing protein [Tanacetum coccineum]